MATLAELRTRITRTVGLRGSVPSADVNGHILDALNDALMGLARKRKWYWWLYKDTTTLASLAAGTESSDMPTDMGHIECIIDPDSKTLYPKTPHKQLHYPEAIGEGSDQTYAIGGYNSTSGCKTVWWSPAVLDSGDYVLCYYRIPAKLSADTDEPDLPAEFHDYIYWRALQQVALSDEERASIVDRYKAEAIEIYRDMEHDHARNIETLSRRIIATP